jgi:hypothetical protein
VLPEIQADRRVAQLIVIPRNLAAFDARRPVFGE